MQYFTLMYETDGLPTPIRTNRPRGELLGLVETMYPQFTRVSLHKWTYSETNNAGALVVVASVYLEPGRKDNKEESHV